MIRYFKGYITKSKLFSHDVNSTLCKFSIRQMTKKNEFFLENKRDTIKASMEKWKNLKFTKHSESRSADLLDEEIDLNIDPFHINQETSESNQPYTDLTEEQFVIEFDKMMRKLIDGFRKLEDSKVSIKKIDNDSKQLEISVSKLGDYTITRDTKNKTLDLTSPESGFFKYQYNQESNFWTNVKDNHILNDLIIREFCKHSTGLLDLE